jgi:hypothetical protein
MRALEVMRKKVFGETNTRVEGIAFQEESNISTPATRMGSTIETQDIAEIDDGAVQIGMDL